MVGFFRAYRFVALVLTHDVVFSSFLLATPPLCWSLLSFSFRNHMPRCPQHSGSCRCTPAGVACRASSRPFLVRKSSNSRFGCSPPSCVLELLLLGYPFCGGRKRGSFSRLSGSWKLAGLVELTVVLPGSSHFVFFRPVELLCF